MDLPSQWIVIASVLGLGGGLRALAVGLGGYRMSGRILDTPGTPIRSVAAGEARVTGVVEPAELLLVSPLQSVACVYYRSAIEEREERSSRTVFREERAVGFRVRDESGSIRVFPRGARWAIADRFSEHTSMLGGQPPALSVRTGAALIPGSEDRDAAVARLLTPVEAPPLSLSSMRLGSAGGRSSAVGALPSNGSYREARLEPGDVITIVGFVQPFDQLPDPAGSDEAWPGDAGAGDPLSDPAVAADLAEAQASGELLDDPAEAWGNAAIEGFGIGRPVREPHLDAGARAMPLADAETARRVEQTFAIAPETLVVTASRDVPLLVTRGGPGQAANREERRFIMGLLGAALAIGSAVSLAVTLTSRAA